MKVLTVFDLTQYQFVLHPINEELTRRGHTVVHTKEHRGIDATIGIQSPSGWTHAAGHVFWLSHGISCTKGWGLPASIRAGHAGKASKNNKEPWLGTHWAVPAPYWTQAAERREFGDKYTSHLVGWTKTDVLVDLNNRRHEIREEVFKHMKWDPDKPLIGYYPTYQGGGHARRKSVDPEAVCARLRGPYNVACVGHQMEGTGARSLFKKVVDSVWTAGLLKLKIFAAADLIITDVSSMAYESCVFDRPILLLDNPDDPAYLHQEHCIARPTIDMGPAVVLEGLPWAVEHHLNHPSHYAERRRFWQEYVLGQVDGKCAARLADAIENAVGK